MIYYMMFQYLKEHGRYWYYPPYLTIPSMTFPIKFIIFPLTVWFPSNLHATQKTGLLALLDRNDFYFTKEVGWTPDLAEGERLYLP